jgi:hypothetical protein
MAKWWAQSKLIGTEEILCGYRDKQLFVRGMEKFNVNDMVRMGLHPGYWGTGHQTSAMTTLSAFWIL